MSGLVPPVFRDDSMSDYWVSQTKQQTTKATSMGIVESLAFYPPPDLVGREEIEYMQQQMEGSAAKAKEVWLLTSRGDRVPVLHFERGAAAQTILFCHGNAVDIGVIYSWLHDLSEVTNSSVVAVEYPGYMDTYCSSSFSSEGVAKLDEEHGLRKERATVTPAIAERAPVSSSTTRLLKPSESGCFAAARAGLKYCLEEAKVEASDLVLMGRSLGTVS